MSSNFTTGNVDNVNSTTVPFGWASDDLPFSLVTEWNNANARPAGWCNEITEWPLMGADVDQLPVASLPKSPAHRIHDGDACTASTSSTRRPAPPILLQ